MKKLSFKGGIHLDDEKLTTKDSAISKIDAPKKVVIPLLQHIGALLSSLVNVGDYVKVGQKIADSDSFISVPVHSSISGTVIEIGMHPHPNGSKCMAIVIENDFKENLSDDVKPKGSYKSFSKEEIIKIIREAGIVGMGGATFPTHVKLSPPKDKIIDTVIVNGAECEPYITSDHRVMKEQVADVIYGLKTIMYVLGLSKGTICVEDNKLDAVDALTNALNGDSSTQVAVLKTKYPQGGEKQIIKSITNREVPSGKLPSDVGVVVFNVDTCAAIARVLKTGMPLIRRIVTVSGSAVNRPQNLEVKIGTTFGDVFEAAGGLSHDVAKIIMGGPMMGIAQFTLDAPVIKATSALLAFKDDDVKDYQDDPCIRCGKCVNACPMGLMPLYLNFYSQRDDFENLKKYSVMDCIECGACSYLCPGRKNPLESIRIAKLKISNK